MGRWRIAFVAAMLVLLGVLSPEASAREERFGDANIAVELLTDGAPRAGETWMLALRFRPSGQEWHGYWSNPGDAGQGLELELDLPDGWKVGAPLYPVPRTLLIGGLMNHVYEGEYAVLVPVTVPPDARTQGLTPVRGYVTYLACTDRICVPQDAVLRSSIGGDFDRWRTRLAPLLDSEAGYEVSADTLRVGIPLPPDLALNEPHVFVQNTEVPGGYRPDYAGPQTFIRQGNLLVAEIPLTRFSGDSEDGAETLSGILSFGNDEGVRFAALPADVPLEGVAPIAGPATPALWQLVLGALVGGVLLNILPCVFPILSLKALALAKAGGAEAAARRDALAYTAGVVLACAALGGAVLVLRSAGEQVGWAFQLQEPVVIVVLLLLASAITANFLGVFELPGLAISGNAPSRGGSFSTGLLAAFVATPCTGPFMAVALGAALVIPPVQGLAIFVALGLGLALPFLLVGFVPAIRSRLPAPGPWMERFRRWLAVPMGLTVMALAWLVWRIGGADYLLLVLLLTAAWIAGLAFVGLLQRKGSGGLWPGFAALSIFVALAVALLPRPSLATGQGESLLAPVQYNDAALAEARETGSPVFVWFTADWCVTCKVNESVAIERASTKAAFEDAGVIAMRGDWTRRDEEISRKLAEHGAAGVPLYLWYDPGESAETLPQVLTPDLLAKRARAARATGTPR